MDRATLVSVVGARPQFIKLAPVCRALEDMAPRWRHLIVHTGQHYDYGMSQVFFDELHIPRPDSNLEIGSGMQGAQTGAMLAALEAEFTRVSPHGILVYGDTNSTLAASIAAAKMQIPQFHVEAGLRSFDRGMPEEINRIVADHCAELLFAPTEQAMRNLRQEGLADRAVNVGDVMYDAVLYNAEIARRDSSVMTGLEVAAGRFALVTVHRAAATAPDALAGLIRILADLSEDTLPILFPMHPRTRNALQSAAVVEAPNLHIVEPQPYLDMLALVSNARLVLTDSGGLQKEAAFLGVPCVTLRDSTEWVETLEIGANCLTGLSRTRIRDAVNGILRGEPSDWSARLPQYYGDGNAAEKIVSAIIEWRERAAVSENRCE